MVSMRSGTCSTLSFMDLQQHNASQLLDLINHPPSHILRTHQYHTPTHKTQATPNSKNAPATPPFHPFHPSLAQHATIISSSVPDAIANDLRYTTSCTSKKEQRQNFYTLSIEGGMLSCHNIAIVTKCGGMRWKFRLLCHCMG